MAVEWSRDWSSHFLPRNHGDPRSRTRAGKSLPGASEGAASATTWSPPPAPGTGREHLSVVSRRPGLVVWDSRTRRSTQQAIGIKANTKASHDRACLGAHLRNVFVLCHFASVFDTKYPILHRPALMFYFKRTLDHIDSS